MSPIATETPPQKKLKVSQEDCNSRLANGLPHGSPTRASVKRRKVCVRVPATSANMGPGFDAIGMAIDIWNEIIVERADKFSVRSEGEGSSTIPTDVSDVEEGKESKHLVLRALKRAFEYAGEEMPPLSVTTRNYIPVCSGFGSSSSAIVGGLIAGLVLAGKEVAVVDTSTSCAMGELVKGMHAEELLHLATEIEGHPDNVAPAIYGGIQLSVQTSSSLDPECATSVLSRRIPFPSGLRIVAYVPSESARLANGLNKTDEMRNLLKPTIPRSDAVVNIQRTGLLIDALHRGDLDMLRFAMRDALHQPQRGEHAYPHLEIMMRAALSAGAHGAFLSGAGPTILAICSGHHGDIFVQRTEERQERKVAEAMKKALEEASDAVRERWGKGQFYIVSPTYRGAHVFAADPKFSDGLATFASVGGDSL